MSLDGGITHLASWGGNTIMPTLSGLFFAGAVYRYSKGGAFEQFLYGGFPYSSPELKRRAVISGERCASKAAINRCSFW